MKKIILIVSLLLSFHTLAGDLNGLTKLFKDTFWTDHYEERFCGKNIEKLVRKAIDKNIDLNDVEILEITDSSGWMFGMVNALQARESGRYIEPRQSNPSNLPGESNWYFHVVLKVEGKILDYDFMNEATVLNEKDYFLKMFIPSDKQSNADYKMRKMKGYEITTYPAEDYILRRDNRQTSDDIKVKYKFPTYMPMFFN
jgi:hypothetical protein